MHQSTPGARFEFGVIDTLRRVYFCDVYTSDTLDRMHGVDGEIRGFGSTALAKPVQVQLTRRIDHFSKLNAYLNTRWLNKDIVSLYVEVVGAAGVHETAEHLAWAAREVQELEPYESRPIFGLRIDDDAVFFDPFERLRGLNRERTSLERFAALRSGTVYRHEEHQFWIMDDACQQTYRAHYIDVSETSLRRRLREGEVRIPVRFLPVAQDRATDVRSALSSRSVRKS